MTLEEAKRHEASIREAVGELNQRIHDAHKNGVHTRIYVDGSVTSNAAGCITFCDIHVIPSRIEMEGEFE